jgi:predicted component of viral defense system (DUF524 family)
MEREAWRAIERLIPLLASKEDISENLFSWKLRPKRIVSARETYSWRRAIDLIKEANLDEKCAALKENPEVLFLMKSKPIMLRMAGEITSALLHSYNLAHKITFSQSSSTKPR